MTKGPFWIRRLGRKLLWRYPRLYRPIGMLRGRGDVCAREVDVWIGGFPRSANTFVVEAFRMANPTVRVSSHHHIPPAIIWCLRTGRPGLFLIRDPEDAVASWTILWGRGLEQSLDYYIDFHRALAPYAAELFIVPFEVAINECGAVIEQFNRRFGTAFASFDRGETAVMECFSRIEKSSPLSGSELSVCRPSADRAKLKPGVLEELQGSKVLARKLRRANALYRMFLWKPKRARLRPRAGQGAEQGSERPPSQGAFV